MDTVGRKTTLHIFRNPYHIHNICPEADPVQLNFSVGTTHCDIERNLNNFGYVIIFKDGINNILSFVLVRDK